MNRSSVRKQRPEEVHVPLCGRQVEGAAAALVAGVHQVDVVLLDQLLHFLHLVVPDCQMELGGTFKKDTNQQFNAVYFLIYNEQSSFLPTGLSSPIAPDPAEEDFLLLPRMLVDALESSDVTEPRCLLETLLAGALLTAPTVEHMEAVGDPGI